MTAARRIAQVSILLVLALQWVWHGWLAPPVHSAPWAMALFFSLPILPAFVLVLLRHRRDGFWGALAALLYFSHGVMAAWSSPPVLGLALVQVLLSAVLIVSASWDGMRARFNKRAAPPAV